MLQGIFPNGDTPLRATNDVIARRPPSFPGAGASTWFRTATEQPQVSSKVPTMAYSSPALAPLTTLVPSRRWIRIARGPLKWATGAVSRLWDRSSKVATQCCWNFPLTSTSKRLRGAF